jgi:hypothetical protein
VSESGILESSEEVDIEGNISDEISATADDPLAFVMLAFEWGKGELKEFDGPQDWQRKILAEIRDKITTPNEAIQKAVASGHGIGKSALVAWIVLWAISTFEDTRGTITADTDTQLRTKTWPELAKWHRLFIAKHWFELTATSIFSKQKDHEKTWRIDIIPWDETNPEAFSGLHNQGRRVIVVFDEASAIHPKIWEATQGVLSDANTQILWFAFGNPTRNTGVFHQCFHSLRHRWSPVHIDSRDVAITNKAQIEKWKQDMGGEDSDFFRVRVRGQFPKAEPDTLIPLDWIEAAMERVVPPEQRRGPIYLGVDVARYGDDDTVTTPKNGRETLPLRYVHGFNTMEVVGSVKQTLSDLCPKREKSTPIKVDVIGLGAGVVDKLSEDGYNVEGVNSSEKPIDEEKFVNTRAEMWFAARESLNPANPACMSLPKDDRLAGDLSAIKILPPDSRGRVRIESKEETKKRLGRSPDAGDSYAMSVYRSYTQFAKPVAVWGHGNLIPLPTPVVPEWV